MVDMALHERALEIWDSARATLESGDRSDLSRLQIEDAFALFEEEIERLRALVSRASEELRLIEMKDCRAIYDVGLRSALRQESTNAS